MKTGGKKGWLVALAALAAPGLFACSRASRTATSLDSGTDTSLQGMDAAVDASMDSEDAGAMDVAVDAGPCGPADVAAFAPTWPSRWQPPAPLAQGRCTPAQIKAYYASCLSTGITDPHACADAVDAGPADLDCYECIFPDEPDAAPGPLVVRGCGTGVNLAGCLANATGDPDASGCTGAWLSADECASTACQACSCGEGVADQRTPCVGQAREAGCSAWQDAASCVASFGDGGADAGLAQQCVTPPATNADLFAFIALFCGAGP